MPNLARLRPGLSLLACAMLATGLAACASGSSGEQASQRTKIVDVSPVTSGDTVAAGYRTTSTATGATCEPGSEAIGQAYRCFAGNTVYDPCWSLRARTPTVLCLPAPWSHGAARLSVSSPLAAIPNEGGIGEPWGVQLRDGKRCLLAQGAHAEFGGTVIDFYCGASLSLLRGLSKSGGSWTGRSVIDKSGHMSAGPDEVIAIAWFGSPVRHR